MVGRPRGRGESETRKASIPDFQARKLADWGEMDAKELLSSTLNGLWSNLYQFSSDELGLALGEKESQGTGGQDQLDHEPDKFGGGTKDHNVAEEDERWLEVHKSDRGHGRRLTVDCRSLASSLASLASPNAVHNNLETGVAAEEGFESNIGFSSSDSLSGKRKILHIPKCDLYKHEHVVGCWTACTVALRGSACHSGCGQGQLYLTNARLVFVADSEDAKSGCRSWAVSLPAIGAVEIRRKLGDRFVSMLELHAKSYRHYIVGFEFEDVADTEIYDFLCFAPGRPILSKFEGPDNISASESVPTPISWGSSLFNADGTRKEYARLGLLNHPFRLSNINANYSLCPTYPRQFVVPHGVSDRALQAIGKFRSKGRVPAVTYRHAQNGATISRCSQPLVGLVKRDRCQEDEAYVKLLGDTKAKSHRGGNSVKKGQKKGIIIVDCRSHTAALGNLAAGRGYEFSANYPTSSVEFHNIENIHVMRDAGRRMLELMRTAREAPQFGSQGDTRWLSRMENTRWLEHVQVLLSSASRCARAVHENGKSIMVHCSDGWDRTPQITSLVQIMLDPHYRTVKGFAVLIEKEWCAFGHKFETRCGHQIGRAARGQAHLLPEREEGIDGKGASHDSIHNNIIGDREIKRLGRRQALSSSSIMFGGVRRGSVQDRVSEDRKDFWSEEECSPVFVQFLDCVHQLLCQFPMAFEFNLEFLSELVDQVYDCRASTFLGDCDRERRSLCNRESGKSAGVSVWDLMGLGPDSLIGEEPKNGKEGLLNPYYDKQFRGVNTGRVIFPDCHPRSVRIWSRRYFIKSNSSRSERLCDVTAEKAWKTVIKSKDMEGAFLAEKEKNRQLVSELERAREQQADLMQRLEMLTGAKDGSKPTREVMDQKALSEYDEDGNRVEDDNDAMVVVTRNPQGQLLTESVVNNGPRLKGRRRRRQTTVGLSNPSSRRNSASRRGKYERRQTIVGAAFNGMTRWVFNAASGDRTDSQAPVDFFRSSRTSTPSPSAQESMLKSTLRIGITEDRYF